MDFLIAIAFQEHKSIVNLQSFTTREDVQVFTCNADKTHLSHQAYDSKQENSSSPRNVVTKDSCSKSQTVQVTFGYELAYFSSLLF